MASANNGMLTSSYLKWIGILLLTFGVLLGLIVLATYELVEAEACLAFVVGGCIVLLLSVYANQVGEENLGMWSIRSSLSRKLRRFVGIFLLVWAFVFYFPLAPVYVGSALFPYTSSLGSLVFYALNSNFPSLFNGVIGVVLNFLSGFSIAYITLIPFVAAGLVVMLPDVLSTIHRLNNEGLKDMIANKSNQRRSL
jgi:hypothetical protein